MAALCAGIKAGGDSGTVEFISTSDVATVNARMKLRQFAPVAIRVACHLSPRFSGVPATAACGVVSCLTRILAVGNGKQPLFR
ncbi:MAG: hypothetical protein ABR905_22100, partial [Terracidiphilus sp.]